MKRLLQLSALVLVFVFSCVKEEPVMYKLTVKTQTGGSVSTSDGEYESGSTVTITATPDVEYEFTGWSNGSKDNPITITLESHQTLQASFTKKKYALNLTVEGEGTVTEEIVSTGKDYDSGTKVKLIAVPAQGWELSKWSGDIDSTEESVEVTLSQAKNITVTFTKKLYNLTVNIVGEGEVNEKIITTGKTTQYEYQTTVELTAIPQEGWQFKEWTGGITGTATQTQITVADSKTVTATFERLYPLTINIVGEGEVKEEIVTTTGKTTNYVDGTIVQLTATPDSEYEFKGWSNGSTENPLTITITSAQTIQANFELKSIQMTMFETIINSNSLAQDIQTTFYNVSGPLHYESDGEHYMLYPGCVSTPQGSIKENLHTVSSQVLKRIDGVWKYFKTFDEAKFYGPRNFEILDKYLVVGDGNEIGENFWEWQGDTYFGEILSGGDIKWIKVNDENNQGYYHGSTIGDLNNDGLLDVGGTPGWYGRPPEYGQNAIKIFTQNSNGQFDVADSILNYGNDNPPFTFDFANIYGDSRDEIITADYGGGDPNSNSDLNQVRVYAYDNSTQKFELHWKSSIPTAFYQVGMGATSIKTNDLDNDGIVDLAIAREDITGNSFEIWKGKGDGTFEPKFSTPIWNQEELQFREFWVLDVNNDNYLDIVLRPFHYGSYYRVNPVWWNVYENNGIKFNHLIWLNNGDGTFSYYDKEPLIQEGINIDNVHPYMDGDSLHFVGTFTEDWNQKKLLTYDFKINLK